MRITIINFLLPVLFFSTTPSYSDELSPSEAQEKWIKEQYQQWNTEKITMEKEYQRLLHEIQGEQKPGAVEKFTESRAQWESYVKSYCSVVSLVYGDQYGFQEAECHARHNKQFTESLKAYGW